MFSLLKWIRAFIGGKSEFGLIVSLLALVGYAVGWPAFIDTIEELLAFYSIVGTFTGVAFLSRIEDKEGFLKAIKTLFSAWRK
jgi:hypothetical protein